MAITNRKKLEAAYTFDGQPFDRALLADKGEKHGPRKTRVYHLAAVPTLGAAGAPEFRTQNATGFFEVEVKITGRFKSTARHTKCDLEATCPLKLQLAPPGTTATVFQKVKCKLAKPKKYCSYT
ncbi:protein YLS9-like [Panicum miliaceum]|uniref:Protein YLS9-like n=1 Tax=Panicum miliaceum TaxID=4540 RepID=A0A3L6QPE2_PANMI|nr:protein YLS9-like [Panicum miliaceum]